MPQNVPDYLESYEIKELLHAAKVYCRRDYVLLSFMWHTGMRVGEVIKVTPKDIEFHRMAFVVRHAKGGKQRRILLDEKMVKMLSDYIAENDIKKNERIFPISRQTVGKVVKRYGAMVGVDVHPHTLRHSFAIHLVRSGVDIRRLQMLMGHSDLGTTAIYLQFDDKDLREALDKVSFT